ncbi:class GN sortase [Aliiglaciecola sp. M165]|uniref:class GN sortase n=1 Tax=Aliiglaciecola sp. M165 TaxID=2593649 RepID=UPI0021B10AB3|nr:class GN sortase [Aliiglaciecola sp. M165]
MHSVFYQESLTTRARRWMWSHKIAVLCFCASLYLFGSSGYIHAKALLAQYLIADAWQESLQSGQPVAPWSWADTYPVAALKIANKHLYVLSGSSGRVLAFGPGHVSSTSLPGEQGNVVISGHRDTHFDVLETVKKADIIQMTSPAGTRSYTVDEIRVAHYSQVEYLNDAGQDMLTLITCYPFDSITPDTPLRLIVRAVKHS